jgi:UDP-N-acetylmuramate dehydrogenase
MSLNTYLTQLPDCTFYPQHDLTGYTTMRIAAVGDLIEVRSIRALQQLLPLLNRHGRQYLMLGWGANQILPAQCQPLVIHLDLPFDPAYLKEVRQEYTLPASIGLNQLTAHAVNFGIVGWEVFTGIPASLGGAIFMNAGTNLGEIGSLVKSVKLVTSEGQLREQLIGADSFSYRHNHFVSAGEVIVEAVLVHKGVRPDQANKIKDYLDYRKQTQPLSTRNCGCVFKNPAPQLPAGKLIDLLALKGVAVGDLKISSKHGNFMENTGRADWYQLKTLINLVQFEMDHFYGIEFELEVKIPYH